MEKEKMTFPELQREMQIGKNKSVKNHSGQTNYYYRNAEQIYEHFKSLNSDWTLIVSDKLYEILGRLFVESTAIVSNGTESYTALGYSEHDQVPIFEKSGEQQMQKPQWTGAVSSYARKYALQGLFAIGENDIDDLQNTNNNETPISKSDGNRKEEKANEQLERALKKANELNAPMEKILEWNKLAKIEAIKQIAAWIEEKK
ncbi:ERF family protein [Lactococcus sp. dk101]|uniref:ERF family protein n=1 Tax=Lactococcus sp. dk101 TaxID=2662430 RepID=UPI001E2EF389|nr:ERF family protein [Lactococcus sp. dk101]